MQVLSPARLSGDLAVDGPGDGYCTDVAHRLQDALFWTSPPMLIHQIPICSTTEPLSSHENRALPLTLRRPLPSMVPVRPCRDGSPVVSPGYLYKQSRLSSTSRGFLARPAPSSEANLQKHAARGHVRPVARVDRSHLHQRCWALQQQLGFSSDRQ